MGAIYSIDYYNCFKDLYYFLYGNSNISRAENIISDLSKLLLYKLLSENQKGITKCATSGKDILDILRKNMPEHYSNNDTFYFSDPNIKHILQKLEPICLSNAPSHIIGDAFQSIIGSNLRGDKGQFFTPKELVECMVSIISPQNNDIIIDPACGTGGFLSEAYIQANKYNKNVEIIGIDKDTDMYNLAYATTQILSKQNSTIYNANSLEILKENHPLSNLIGTADIILTNPPFGTKINITDESILKLYDFGHNWSYSESDKKWYKLDSIAKNQAPQILFIELCIKLLKNYGKMAIVLPEGVFGNKTLGYVWEYMEKHGNVYAMIDCPRNTFQPSTDTKTNVLFFEKNIENTNKVLISVAMYCGHDKRGRKQDSKNKPLNNDFIDIAQDYKQEKYKLWKKVDLKGIYYVPRYLYSKTKFENNNKYITIGDMIKNGYLKKKVSKEIGSEAYGTGNIPFIRTSDINNFEISADPTNSVSEEIYSLYSKQQNLEVGDILFIADGRYRIGKTAIITKHNIKCLIQSHIEILSLTDKSPFSPFEFLYCLNSNEVQEQVRSLIFIQSTLGTIGNRINELSIPLPMKHKKWNKKIELFKNNIETRSECLFNLKKEEHNFEL